MTLETDVGLSFEPAMIGISDKTRSRNILRVTTRKSILLFILFLSGVSLVYFLIAKNGSKIYSVFSVTQNVFVSSNEESECVSIRQDYYSIIFDAGSTGTRIHIFHFRKTDGRNLVLVKDVFRQTKPGLSSYADEPSKAAQSVNSLLKSAIRYVPRKRWMCTPIVLKATAGLRLLPGRKADVILEGVKELFMKSRFQKIGANFVSVMDGDVEGIYGWLSVNYLSAKLKSTRTEELYGALDLGGGSVQITLPLSQKGISNNKMPVEFVKTIDIARNTYSLYTHSYLGLGLMSARASILNASAILQTGNYSDVIGVSSPCFPIGYRDSWKFGGKLFNVIGTDQCSFENCRDLVKKVVSMKHIDKPEQVKKVKIFAFSYFFDRAVDLGLIDEESGGHILVQDYVDKAQTMCQRGSVTEKPFLCLDTSFIVTLLTDGFGIDLHQTLQLKRKIEDFDVSWAVGAALDFYEKARSLPR